MVGLFVCLPMLAFFGVIWFHLGPSVWKQFKQFISVLTLLRIWTYMNPKACHCSLLHLWWLTAKVTALKWPTKLKAATINLHQKRHIFAHGNTEYGVCCNPRRKRSQSPTCFLLHTHYVDIIHDLCTLYIHAWNNFKKIKKHLHRITPATKWSPEQIFTNHFQKGIFFGPNSETTPSPLHNNQSSQQKAKQKQITPQKNTNKTQRAY